MSLLYFFKVNWTINHYKIKNTPSISPRWYINDVKNYKNQKIIQDKKVHSPPPPSKPMVISPRPPIIPPAVPGNWQLARAMSPANNKHATKTFIVEE